MKEANIFEAWASNLVEGTFNLPDTPEKKSKLVALMGQEFPVGTDATNSTEQLYDLLGDDELFDQLEQLASEDPDADCRQVVYDRMQMLSDHPDVKAVIDQIQIDPSAEMNPAPEVDPQAIEPVQEGQMKEIMWRDAERMERDAFCDKYGNEEWVGEFWDNIMGDLDESVKDPATQTEDPAGTKQPDYPEYQDNLAAVLKAAGVDDTVVAAPNYETGVDEAENLSPLSEKGEETDECDASPLAGQYGHSGKMKSVEKDSSFLDRLKELSGMIRN